MSTTQAFSFTYCDGTGFQYTAFPWLTVTLDTWYHVVISIQQLMDSDGTASNAANYFMYINGQQLPGSGAGGPYPNAINRANADIGRSDWSDNFWGGEIDTFRIYNSALTMTQAQALYQNANGGCALNVGSSTANTATLEWLTPSRDTTAIPTPKVSLQFATDPRTQSGVTYPWYWNSSDPYDAACGISAQRSGLLVLPGLDQQNAANGPYINLSATTGPSSLGTAVPNIGGQSSGTQSTTGVATGTAGWTWEYMVKPSQVEVSTHASNAHSAFRARRTTHSTCCVHLLIASSSAWCVWRQTWAKLFDMGQPQSPTGACADDIISGQQQHQPSPAGPADASCAVVLTPRLRSPPLPGFS